MRYSSLIYFKLSVITLFKNKVNIYAKPAVCGLKTGSEFSDGSERCQELILIMFSRNRAALRMLATYEPGMDNAKSNLCTCKIENWSEKQYNFCFPYLWEP